MANQELLDYIPRFKNVRIMVIGDLMIDEYIWGNVSRISPEAPVPVVNVTGENLCLGGAGNVVNNIFALGGKVFIAGVVGNDEMGRKVIHNLRKMGIDTKGIIVEAQRVTTVKTRIIAHHQQVVRYDREVIRPILADNVKLIIALLEEQLPKIDAVLISDYGKGVICGPLMEQVRTLAKEAGKIIAVDPKVKNIPFFAGVTVLTPNHLEAAEAAGRWIYSEEDLMAVGKTLLERLQAQSILITRGERGMSLFQDNGEVTHIPTVAKEVYDVTGAGDTVISVLTLAMASGAPIKEAAVLANIAAGIVVGEVGTATVKAGELEEAVKNGIQIKRRNI